ncbi:hypothetical protein MPTK1_4g10480 [Marchantia polymorpha subsp. ruderalis]|uniref:Uncharacterized protein n=2 Tax=Marchantia polymorpha TaxID=3197 RepID=A0AAF6B8G8_MARPO|nr:hypothetical protein MARPO_0011s0035 [Marchantia polymorpha]BBN08302.1 hypothetical protein Mp_4g10480 [Marchantia polymorpha subsp. ruderalis]|eukprot:PTQ46338.1 hypothetical protein MARPO_0011s0035 [Marchantia polymorpha]
MSCHRHPDLRKSTAKAVSPSRKGATSPPSGFYHWNPHSAAYDSAGVTALFQESSQRGRESEGGARRRSRSRLVACGYGGGSGAGGEVKHASREKVVCSATSRPKRDVGRSERNAMELSDRCMHLPMRRLHSSGGSGGVAARDHRRSDLGLSAGAKCNCALGEPFLGAGID